MKQPGPRQVKDSLFFIATKRIAFLWQLPQTTSCNIPGADWRIDLVTATMGANLDSPRSAQMGIPGHSARGSGVIIYYQAR